MWLCGRQTSRLPLDQSISKYNFHKMVVRKRLEITGPAMAFVTTTVKDWAPVFSKPKLAHQLLKQLEEALQYHDISPAAYVLMPSHLHVLIGLKKIEKLSTVIQSFKSISSKRLRLQMPQSDFPDFYEGEGFQLWKPRFDDLIIWSEKQFKIKIEYIHNNPVKANLANNAVGYEFSSARDWINGDRGIISIDKNWTWLDE